MLRFTGPSPTSIHSDEPPATVKLAYLHPALQSTPGCGGGTPRRGQTEVESRSHHFHLGLDRDPRQEVVSLVWSAAGFIDSIHTSPNTPPTPPPGRANTPGLVLTEPNALCVKTPEFSQCSHHSASATVLTAVTENSESGFFIAPVHK